MKLEMKQKWVEALRSGEYKQGKERLKDFDDDGGFTYCCLGVLCELNNVKFKLTEEEYSGNPTFGVGVDSSIAFPTNSMIRKWGLNSIDMYHLAELNDGGRDFNYIANVIEERV